MSPQHHSQPGPAPAPAPVPAPAPRPGPCQALLLAALGALGAACLGLALCSALRVWPPPLPQPELLGGLQHVSGAHLLIQKASLQDSPNNIELQYEEGIYGVVHSPDFHYNKATHQLEVKVPGLYLLYAQLAVTCVVARSCLENSTVELQVHVEGITMTPAITVQLFLAPQAGKAPSQLSLGMRYLKAGTRLVARLSTEPRAPETWQLDQSAGRTRNFLGLLRLPGGDSMDSGGL